MMNVEDILGFAQFKSGKFIKNIKQFNLRKMINDVMSIQQYQA